MFQKVFTFQSNFKLILEAFLLVGEKLIVFSTTCYYQFNIDKENLTIAQYIV